MDRDAQAGRQIGSMRNFLICSFLPTTPTACAVSSPACAVVPARHLRSRARVLQADRRTDGQIPAAVKMQPRLIRQESLLFVRASSGGAARLCSCLLIKEKD